MLLFIFFALLIHLVDSNPHKCFECSSHATALGMLPLKEHCLQPSNRHTPMASCPGSSTCIVITLQRHHNHTTKGKQKDAIVRGCSNQLLQWNLSSYNPKEHKCQSIKLTRQITLKKHDIRNQFRMAKICSCKGEGLCNRQAFHFDANQKLRAGPKRKKVHPGKKHHEKEKHRNQKKLAALPPKASFKDQNDKLSLGIIIGIFIGITISLVFALFWRFLFKYHIPKRCKLSCQKLSHRNTSVALSRARGEDEQIIVNNAQQLNQEDDDAV